MVDGLSDMSGASTAHDLTVRDATLQDLEAVARWVGTAEECRLWAGPAVSFPIQPGTLAVEIGFKNVENLALADASGTAGFGQLVWRTDTLAHLARIVVRPNARGRGFGRVLVSALLERAASHGARCATLNVYAQNEAARGLYEAAGFTVSGAQGEPACPHGALFMTRTVQPL